MTDNALDRIESAMIAGKSYTTIRAKKLIVESLERDLPLLRNLVRAAKTQEKKHTADLKLLFDRQCNCVTCIAIRALEKEP